MVQITCRRWWQLNWPRGNFTERPDLWRGPPSTDHKDAPQ